MVISKEKAGTSVVRINSKCRRSLTSTEKKSKEKQQKILLLQFGKSEKKKKSRVSSIPNQFTRKFQLLIQSIIISKIINKINQTL